MTFSLVQKCARVKCVDPQYRGKPSDQIYRTEDRLVACARVPGSEHDVLPRLDLLGPSVYLLYTSDAADDIALV